MGRCQGAFCGPKVISILAKELNIPEEEVLKDSKGSQIIVGKTKASYEKHSK
jgi:glycerol-3-phosphate dehydrogenase